MYYLEQLQREIATIQKEITESLSTVDSAEFEQRNSGEGYDAYPAKTGFLQARLSITSIDVNALTRHVESIAAQLPYLERLQHVCEELGIDGDTLPELELMIAESHHAGRYRSERASLEERITETIGEIRTDRVEFEKDNCVTMLEAAGFKATEDDGNIYERDIAAPHPQRIYLTWERQHSWYAFRLEVNERETLAGKSGEFGKLLEAVGISQNTEVVK